MTQPLTPTAIAIGAVKARIAAAKELYVAAVWERDAAAQAEQRAALHALIDEELDITGGVVTNLMRGQQ